MIRDLVILLAIAGALFVGGYFMVREINKTDFELSYQVSIEQEEELGNVLKDVMIDQYKIMESNAADSAIQAIKPGLSLQLIQPRTGTRLKLSGANRSMRLPCRVGIFTFFRIDKSC